MKTDHEVPKSVVGYEELNNFLMLVRSRRISPLEATQWVAELRNEGLIWQADELESRLRSPA